MTVKQNVEDLVTKINNAYTANQYPSYIDNLRFPYYKSISPNAKIIFSFPITVFIGINGSGKSSALHALYGCPEGSSTGNYWFTTPLDPIRQDRRKGEIPSIIYEYRIKTHIFEVIKRRSGVAKGLDYWETSRPIKMYGMKLLEEGKRNPPINKNVIFLDFRSELSAFDKFFHFGTFKQRKTITSKQDYLRKYSEYVRQVFQKSIIVNKYGRANKIPAQKYGDEALKTLSHILGKSYSYCLIAFHNFYGDEGATILFNSNQKKYSEAFAGRGEFAVAKLVYEIFRAPKGSLIILDEPEVSLHPSAQERLKIFLLEQCLKNKLQIVLSTHSPKLVEYLPNEAIKLFYEEESGKFNVLNNCSYHEVFHQIGERIDSNDKKIIIVEDTLAKILLENIINNLEGNYSLLFTINNFPGGAEHAIKSAILYSQENEINKFLILDGDKRRPHFNPEKFTVEEIDDAKFLELKLKESTNSDFKNLGFRIDGNFNGGNKEQKKMYIKKFLKFQYTNIHYLPCNIPEEIIWDDILAYKLLSLIDNDSKPVFPINYKEKFEVLSKLLFSNSSADFVEKVHIIFIKNFVSQKSSLYHSIVEILDKFK